MHGNHSNYVILLSKFLFYSRKDQKSYKEHKYGRNFYLGQIGISYFYVKVVIFELIVVFYPCKMRFIWGCLYEH